MKGFRTMFASRQNLHTPSSNPENISVLVATPHPEDLNSLRHILQHHDWSLSLCTSAREAVEKAAQLGPAILICERDLPDGTWKDVLHRMESMVNPPLILVVSKHADDSLWAEVLNLGGYDVLLKPFDRSEVTRVVGMAWRQWFSMQRQPATVPVPELTPQFV
jgi:DNA-binding response OmpR family regulator